MAVIAPNFLEGAITNDQRNWRSLNQTETKTNSLKKIQEDTKMPSKDDDITYSDNLAPPFSTLVGVESGRRAEDEDGNRGYGKTDEEAREDLERRK
ncbi:TPA: hypothetical protein DCZ46_03455 [Candidatus Campbellbacteria bacterium]|nr:MAG: hypothetical protein UR58_C0001G0661 [Candidatus Campbellbacteria bacterium GW2011_OD1_34_28]KKP74814.1 MAG: hypothetical protein UR74_C0002G0080 [Candidatus Campbellbacteria bacterium GW2011_GWD2_35_24]KKP75700.1 MAG: hypothetical protein UR75_C0002G0081 [Candidatus Campbellbacteria bacterium GW2011_GWC2_35_28]KKP77052.1 MAG: hypothetical protein UR76_C0002G0253 [Candidatus Campbellbacteria bacterium GW2011_GWC1_35_31]KKP78978.1 MAG: hypothetical protein UR79_C0002G0253 [Candidatus Cam